MLTGAETERRLHPALQPHSLFALNFRKRICCSKSKVHQLHPLTSTTHQESNSLLNKV